MNVYYYINYCTRYINWIDYTHFDVIIFAVIMFVMIRLIICLFTIDLINCGFNFMCVLNSYIIKSSVIWIYDELDSQIYYTIRETTNIHYKYNTNTHTTQNKYIQDITRAYNNKHTN